jgi:hypothetical protein
MVGHRGLGEATPVASGVDDTADGSQHGPMQFQTFAQCGISMTTGLIVADDEWQQRNT